MKKTDLWTEESMIKAKIQYTGLSDYEIKPSVVLSGETGHLTITPRDRQIGFLADGDYLIEVIPMETSPMRRLLLDPNVSEPLGDYQPDRLVVRPVNGTLSFEYRFFDEQQYAVNVWLREQPRETKIQFRIYSLMPDLYTRRPFKGDLHVHSSRSDGKGEPALVAANYRQQGYDFLAITDHHKWQPSIEAINAYADSAIEMKLFPGEEVHIGGYMHAVNFGGRFGITDRYESNRAKYDAEIELLAADPTLPDDLDHREFALRKWVSDQIRAAGGMSILAHPYWSHPYLLNYNMQNRMTDYLLETGSYDAYEVLSRYARMNQQVSFYQEQLGKGRKIPVVGASDNHNSEAEDNFKNAGLTIALAADCEYRSIYESIIQLYSVAVQNLAGQFDVICGPHRLVKYVAFLRENYDPGHDALCVEQGRQMKAYIQGDIPVGEIPESLNRAVHQYTADFFR